MLVGVWGLGGACPCGQPQVARFPPGAPTRPPTPFPGSCLPACWPGRKAGPRGLRSPCPQVTVGLPGWLHSAVRKSGSHQIKPWALPTPPPPQEALPPPGPSQPGTQAGARLGMNFITISLWFHYECPDPGQPPRLLGPPLHSRGQKASLPLRLQPEDAWPALTKVFPGSPLIPWPRNRLRPGPRIPPHPARPPGARSSRGLDS